MNDSIYYKGSPKEWKQLHSGYMPKINSKGIVKNKTIKMYSLLYRGEIVLRCAPYGVCKSKQNQLTGNNFLTEYFKIVKN